MAEHLTPARHNSPNLSISFLLKTQPTYTSCFSETPGNFHSKLTPHNNHLNVTSITILHSYSQPNLIPYEIFIPLQYQPQGALFFTPKYQILAEPLGSLLCALLNETFLIVLEISTLHYPLIKSHSAFMVSVDEYIYIYMGSQLMRYTNTRFKKNKTITQK